MSTQRQASVQPAEGKDGKEDAKSTVEPGSYSDLYRFADCTDLLLTFCGGVAASLGASVLPAFSIVFGELMDSFDPRNSVNFLDLINDLSAVMAIVSAGSFLTYMFQVTAFKIASERQAVRIRREHFRAVLRQDVGWFDAQEATELVSRLGDNARDMKNGMGHQAGLLVNFTGTFLAGVGTGFYFSWRLTLTIIALVPVMAFIGAISMRFMTWTKAASAEAYAKAGGVAEEHLRAIRTVQTFGGEDRAAAKYTAYATEAGEVGKRKGLIAGVGSGLTNGLMFLAFAVVFWVGGFFIADDRIDVMDGINQKGCVMDKPYDVGAVCVDEFFAALAPEQDSAATCAAACEDDLLPCVLGDTCITGGVVMMVMFSVVFGGMMLGMAEPPLAAIAGGKTAARIVAKLMDRKPTVDAAQVGGTVLDSGHGDIVFKDVKFSYPSRPDAPVLQGLNLHCEAGKTTALCGASGCGKSTTIALLERFYDPDEGTVSIAGHDLRDLQLRSLRSHFGLVAQEPIVFADTIFKNIAFGHSDPSSISREEVEAAAKAANAHDFISAFPDGYDTFVGQGGSSISGGQKQRIAIARAIIRDPSVLLLDEATSALDNESERVVQEALDNLLKAKKRTTLVIAHRLSTIRNADKIVVFDAGRIVEEGTHDELVACDGAYANLLRKQHGSADDSADYAASETPRIAASGETKTDDLDGAAAASQSSAGVGVSADEVKPTDEDVGDASSESTSSKKRETKGEELDKDAIPDPMEDFKVDSSGSRLFSVGRSDAGWIALGTVGAIFNGLAMPLFALIYAEVVAAFYQTKVEDVRDDTQWFSILYLAVAAVTVFTYIMQFGGYEIAGERLVARVRSMAFRRVMHLEMQFFDRKKNSSGAVSTRLSEEAATVRGLTGERLGVFATNVVTLTAGIAIALEASWKLTLVVIGILPLVAVASSLELLAIGGDQSEQPEEKKELETAGRILSESVHGIRTVQAFGLENILADVYGERLMTPYRSARGKSWLAGAGYGFSQAAQYGAMGLIFYIGGLWANDGDLTLNDLMRVMMGLLMSAMGAGQASALAPDVGKAGKAARALFRMIDFRPEIDSASSKGEAPSTVGGNLSFQDVCFTYPTRASSPVLKGLSLEIKAGQTVALVGRSGCGKSTLMSLILQFYRPESGKIALDGVPLSDYNVKWLRAHCGVVSQEPVLIGDGGSTGSTIRQAIAYGAPEGTVVLEEAIINAAKSANAHDFITGFPEGYDTVIGAGGAAMSGGQKQRIAIARAILRDPAILLLDEATSALDTESEHVVQAALDKLLQSKGRTTLVIAHRLSTVKNADLIAVIDEGVVVESGTHAELLALNGIYAAQWQQGGGAMST